MKKDEVFNPSSKSVNAPAGLLFRLASRTDCSAISNLMHERNPLIEINQILANTNRELDRVETDDY